MPLAKLLKQHQVQWSSTALPTWSSLALQLWGMSGAQQLKWETGGKSQRKNHILFSEIPWDVIIRVVSTFCFPLSDSLSILQYQLIVKGGCREATAPTCCWSPEEGLRSHKWPQNELFAQRFPTGSHMNVHVCTVESATKLQLGDAKSFPFLNTHWQLLMPKQNHCSISSWHPIWETQFEILKE